ncbi:RING-type E3 ubiquitin transferase [Sarracenia purpurea var. burkii]
MFAGGEESKRGLGDPRIHTLRIEEKHRDLFRLVMQFIPSITPPQLPGLVFRTFLQNLLLKNRGAYRNLPPIGVSSNFVLVSLFIVILHFLSEGFAMGDISVWMKVCGTNMGPDVGFIDRGGQQSFPMSLLLKIDPHRVDLSRLGGSFNNIMKKLE